MNLQKAVRQIVLAPIMEVRVRWRRYVVSMIIIVFALPFLRAIDWYLRGTFVGSVEYMGLLVNYAVFASVGIIMEIMLSNILYGTETVLSARYPLLLVATEHPLVVPIAIALQIFVSNVPYVLVFATAFSLLVHVPFHYVLIAYVLVFLGGAFVSLSLGILFSVAGLYVRGRDYRNISRMLHRGLWIIVPTVFGISAYPEGIRDIMLLVPTVSLVEGVRRMVFGVGGYNLFVYAFFSGILLLLFSYAVYKRAFESARRSGRIMLQ